MTKLDQELMTLLNNYTLNVISDVVSESEVDYKDVFKGEIIPAIKALFNYEDLEPLAIREERFRLSVLARLGDYTEDELTSFYNHWTAKGDKDRKMKFEKEKTWMLSGRLATWRKLSKKFNIINSINKGQR